MRPFIYILFLVSTLLIDGCGKSVSRSDITAYGVERFVSNVLSFEITHITPSSIQDEFSPKRVEEHLNGVLLVYSESPRWIQGIYVDKKELAGWGGSGFEVEEWFPQIAWVRIKRRGSSNRPVQRTGASSSGQETSQTSLKAGSRR